MMISEAHCGASETEESVMRRLTPSLALLGLVLIGCGGSSDESPPSGTLHQATIEVRGMT